MAIPLNKLAGMTKEIEGKLKEKNIYDSDQLVDAGRTPHARSELAKQCGLSRVKLLALYDRADLARIHGVGGVLSDLLEHVEGVKAVPDLARQRPEYLHHALEDIIESKKINYVGNLPSLEMVKDWIKQAKALEGTQ